MFCMVKVFSIIIMCKPDFAKILLVILSFACFFVLNLINT